MWCRRHTSRDRTDRVRGPVSILFLSLIVFAGAQCKRRSPEPAKPVAGFSIEYKEKVNPLEYFPLAVGNKWTYASTYRSGVASGNSIMTVKWITEHIITAKYDISEGKVFLGKFIIRDVRYDDPPDASKTELEWFRDHFGNDPNLGPASLWTKNYLVAGNYVFDLDDEGWDAAAQGLSARYRERSSWDTPILFFPLDRAYVWSYRRSEERDYQAYLLWKAGKGPSPDPAISYWNVNEREDVEVPYRKVRDAVKLTYTTNFGGTTTVWFKEGLGFVKAWFDDDSSYHRCETTLLDFTPASAAK